MGFFNKLDDKEIKLNFTESAALALLSMGRIDGEIDDSEMDYLLSLSAIEKDDLDYAIEIYKEASVMDCVEIVAKGKNIDGKAHLLIIELLIDMARKDGEFSESEELLLEVFIDKLDVTKSEVSEMIKNR